MRPSRSVIIGPRIGRFDASGKVNEMRGHSATLVVMGTFLLWFGFYGFNPGSNLTIATKPLVKAANARWAADGMDQLTPAVTAARASDLDYMAFYFEGDASAIIVSRITVTTTLAAATSGLVTLFWRYFSTSNWDTILVCNGCLAGLVSICSGCALVEPWAAVICGFVSAFTFVAAEWAILHKMKIVGYGHLDLSPAPSLELGDPYERTQSGKTELREHLKRHAARPYVERLSDAHLLLWLAKQPNLDPSDMALLCEAVRESRPVLEGYRVIIDSIAGISQ
ncbi:Ammonium transporter 1 member 2 [Tetrabaena socialis]|uniref:Ammonium transporter 1 member 2 n=1 Tax=Tetrabaena socialis TaxID=47790 RepID=A0A2J7ZZI0_9CHLO|nr:Ammonium transporter 1 member 2 [Tetrabaena socialis]|eukprot:PNH05672.1 Ammonium transporter 1 member 2 [Tetrabaena socialis]